MILSEMESSSKLSDHEFGSDHLVHVGCSLSKLNSRSGCCLRLISGGEDDHQLVSLGIKVEVAPAALNLLPDDGAFELMGKAKTKVIADVLSFFLSGLMDGGSHLIRGVIVLERGGIDAFSFMLLI